MVWQKYGVIIGMTIKLLRIDFTVLRRKLTILIATALITMFIAIGIPNWTVGQSTTNLLVSAAGSLQDVLNEIKPMYQQNYRDVNISFNFGASGALQQQIEQGASVDIFISAAKKQVDALEKKNLLLPESRVIIAKNRLVLITPKKVSTVNSFYALQDVSVKRIAIGEPRSVPAGQYAKQVLEQLKIWSNIKSKMVYGNNVRQVLAAVESGNADAGLVYATDAKISGQVKVVVVADEKFHSPIIYPLGIIRGSKNIDAAKNFSKFLVSNPSKTVFKKYGFIVP
jgi:molybdate transport system substrate-binding protein